MVCAENRNMVGYTWGGQSEQGWDHEQLMPLALAYFFATDALAPGEDACFTLASVGGSRSP